ncbi:MAG: hypothetical protein DHS20C14_04530 [Phycisphaeraceae bacterium]|nr:MAG: hypothetical protein DHS20C14_04530 [Phycisphaeraceae bacterium]
MASLTATTLRVRPVGTTIDFCPVCRRERSFRFAEAQAHRYALVFDRGPIAHPHHELTCESCGAIMERAVEERPVTMTSAAANSPLAEPEVLPLVRQRIADWADMETRRRADKLHPDEREEMIRTAMLSFARLYDERPIERVHPMTRFTLTVVVAALMGGGAWAWLATGNRWLLVGGACAGVAISIGALVWIRSRCPRTRVRRWVAAALAPLDPTEAEVTAIKREMLTSRLKSGECIKPARMLKEIAHQRERLSLVKPKTDRAEPVGPQCQSYSS